VVVSVSNNEKKIVPVVGISASAFSNSTVTSVYLSDKITEIPESAFENCKSLKYVRGGTIDTIGKNAFKNCTSLFEFVLPDIVTSLGESAFENVAALTVDVANPDVLDAALNSGVKALSVDLSAMTGSIDGKKIVTPATMEFFSISGGGRVYNKLSLESSANTVVLNNLTISNYADVPLKLTGPNVELSFVTINAGGLIMRLDADNTYVTLNGNNHLVSSGKNAMLSKNIHFFEKEDTTAAGKACVTGNVLVYGTANGIQCVSFDSAAYKIVYLTEDEYTNMLKSHSVYFDANGGSTDTTEKTVTYLAPFGELPVAQRDYYDFDGWYTAAGTRVTNETIVETTEPITLTARWILHETSGWVIASEAPADAQIVETKYSYDQTYYTTSDSNSMDGWTHYNTTSAWGDYGAWSEWSTDQYEASDSREVEKEQRSNWVDTSYDKTQYHYYHACCACHPTWLYTAAGMHQGHSEIHDAWFDYELPYYKTSGDMNWYEGPWCSKNHSPYWFKADGISNWQYSPFTRQVHVEDGYTNYYDVWRYRDRSLIYTYHFSRVEKLESVSNPTGENISNVVEWVRYRAK